MQHQESHKIIGSSIQTVLQAVSEKTGFSTDISYVNMPDSQFKASYKITTGLATAASDRESVIIEGYAARTLTAAVNDAAYRATKYIVEMTGIIVVDHSFMMLDDLKISVTLVKQELKMLQDCMVQLSNTAERSAYLLEKNLLMNGEGLLHPNGYYVQDPCEEVESIVQQLLKNMKNLASRVDSLVQRMKAEDSNESESSST